MQVGDDEQAVDLDVEDHDGSSRSSCWFSARTRPLSLWSISIGEGGVPAEPDQQTALGDHEELGAGERHRVGVAGHRLQHGHLAEEVALTQRRHHRALLALAAGDLDDARLDHEEVDPLLALAEDDLARFDGALRVTRKRLVLAASPRSPRVARTVGDILAQGLADACWYVRSG